MEYSVRSFALVSLMLLVSLSTDMSGPLVVDARRCDLGLCRRYCSLLGKPGCCAGLSGPCRCQSACPRYVTTEITEEVMIGATDEEPFIEETVIA